MSIIALGTQFVKTTFPGGESCIRVTAPVEDRVTIALDFESNSDLFDMMLLADAIRRVKRDVELQLYMCYVPYARQDRVCNPGESLSIKVVADLINSLNFSRVMITDPHSEVTPALLDGVIVVPQESAVPALLRSLDPANTVVVAPDGGAAKKGHKFAQEGKFVGFVKADKVRCLLTAKILDTSVVGIPHIGDQDFLIVDDICDGGRTFTELAKKLRPLTNGRILLYVTHGIFSAGTEVFDNLIDAVYTANPVGAKGVAAVASGKVIRI